MKTTMFLKLFLIMLALMSWRNAVLAQWQYNGTSIYYNGGNVGIGLNNP